MKVHLIFVTKYRRKLFTSEESSDDVKQFLYDAARRYGYKILQMETDGDHIHILLEYGTRAAASTIVKHLKQYSTFWMWKYHENYLSKQYWKKKVLWSDGYFACSIGQASQETIEKYIQNQG